MSDLARSCELNGRSSVFSTHPAFDGRSARLPCTAPLIARLIGFVDKPVHGLLGGADNNADAAISNHEGLLPSMYQHGQSPVARGVDLPQSTATPHRSVPEKRNRSREMNEFPIAQPVARGFISPAPASHADECFCLPTSGNEGCPGFLSGCMPIETALAGVDGSLVAFTGTEGPIIRQKISGSRCGPDETHSVRQADENRLTPCGLKHRSPLFDTKNGRVALSQHFCFSGGGYECRPRFLGAPALTQRSQTAAFSRFIKIALGIRPTVTEAFKRIIGAVDPFAKTISNPNKDGSLPRDIEVDFNDVRHFAPFLFKASRTCALGICSEGDVAA